MIPRSAHKLESADWQIALRDAYTQPAELLALLGLEAAALGLSDAAARSFAFRVPRAYAALMQHGDPHDPLLRQVLPVAAELRQTRGYVSDPVGDLAAQPQPGLLHKYQGRALLVVTGACAIHCRYCFRREFPYGEAVGSARLDAALLALAAAPDIEEVILSGGDPLTLRDERLANLVARVAALPQVRRLRVHSRLAVTLPSRITPALIRWLSSTRLAPVLVVHANHAHELTAEFARALAPLRAAGVTLLNQSVLLRGVNDSPEVLVALSRRLHDCGVLPYYLHALDRVRGTAHFAVSTRRARLLLHALRQALPGYLVPRFVREIPGAAFKVPLG
ncbi:MAG: EF-P beta-lysylation protein EpmB [Gammaproteobacteria bacterium]|nr:EF-P beta-lysylation protein EpmB [Gammaproteobacteria bacterium]